MASSEQDESQSDFYIHAHRYKFAPPDIVRVWWNGSCSSDEMRRFVEAAEQRYGTGDYYVIADVSKLVVDSLMREMVARNPKMQRVAGLAILGASFHMRVLVTMMSRAMSFLQGGAYGTFTVSNTEAEAISWIANQRALRSSR